jgi:hypothetical protein
VDEAGRRARAEAAVERDRIADRRWPAEQLVDTLAVALRRHHQEMARRLGLREVELACLQLVDRPRPLSMTALAERLGLSRAGTTAVVDRLVALRRVVRWQHEDDRRKTVVAAVASPGRTPPWRRLVDELAASQNGFSDEELRVVTRWMLAMSDELHRRAGDLTVARGTRARTERTNLYSSIDSRHSLP